MLQIKGKSIRFVLICMFISKLFENRVVAVGVNGSIEGRDDGTALKCMLFN